MKRKNIGILSSASLLFAAVLAVVYIYIYGAFSPVESITPSIVHSILSDDLIWLQSEFPIPTTISALAILIIGAMLSLSVPTRYNLFGRASQIPIFLYVCAITGFAATDNILSAPLAALFGTCSLRDFYRAYQSSAFTSKLFTAAFWMGFLPMFYPSTIVLWIGAFVFMIIFVRSLREILVVIVGLVLPIATLIYVRWMFGCDINVQISELMSTIVATADYRSTPFIYYHVALLSIIALLSLYGVFSVSVMSLRYVARMRIYCVYILAALGVVMFLLPSFSFESYAALASPLSIAVTPALLRMRSWITMPLFVTILLLSALPLLVGWIIC